MKTAIALAIALSAFAGCAAPDALAGSAQAGSPKPLYPRSDRSVGTWEYEVHLFACDTGQTRARFRAATLFNAGGTLLDTNTSPPATRGPAFGTWRYDRASRSWIANMRFYRYNPDGSYAGANEVQRTLTFDGDASSGRIVARVLGPNEEPLATSCGEEIGTRSL